MHACCTQGDLPRKCGGLTQKYRNHSESRCRHECSRALQALHCARAAPEAFNRRRGRAAAGTRAFLLAVSLFPSSSPAAADAAPPPAVAELVRGACLWALPPPRRPRAAPWRWRAPARPCVLAAGLVAARSPATGPGPRRGAYLLLIPLMRARRRRARRAGTRRWWVRGGGPARGGPL